jgi:alginate O-acetyltransferase complex protein AlgI
MATRLLGGLWHGANWTVAVWGGLHGLYLSAERALRNRFAGYRPGPAATIALGLLTWMLVNVTWVFFRAKDFGAAWQVLRGMSGQNGTAEPILDTVFLVVVPVVVAGIVISHWLMRRQTLESMLTRAHPMLVAVVWGTMLFAIIISQGSGNAFIYFQF